MLKEIVALLRDYATNPIKYIVPDSLIITSGELKAKIEAIRDILIEKFELEELGFGQYSYVFALTDKLVLKVNCRYEDKAYDNYIDYAMRNQGNPYVPRIYYRGNRNSTCRFYIMERLEPRESPYEDNPVNATVNIVSSISYNSMRSGVINFKDENLQRLMMEYGAENFSDVGGSNVMMRGNQLVFTDPCC